MGSSDPTAKKSGRARLRLSKGDRVLAEVSLGSKRVVVGSGAHAKIRLKKKGLPEEILILDGTQNPVVLESRLPPDKVFLNGWAVSRGFFKPGDKVEFLGLTLEMLAGKPARAAAVAPAQAPSTDQTGTAPEAAARAAMARGRAGRVPRKKTQSSPIAADSTAPEAPAAPRAVAPVHPVAPDTTAPEAPVGRSVPGVSPVLDRTDAEIRVSDLEPVVEPFGGNTEDRIRAAEAEIAAMTGQAPPPAQPGRADPPGPVPMDVSDLLSQVSVADPFPEVNDDMLEAIPPRTDLVGDDQTSSQVALDLTGPAQGLFGTGEFPVGGAPPAPPAPTHEPAQIDIIDVRNVGGESAPEARQPGTTTRVQGDPLAAALSDALSDGLNPFEPQGVEDPTGREPMLRAADAVRGRTQSRLPQMAPPPMEPPVPEVTPTEDGVPQPARTAPRLESPFRPVKDDITGPENLDDPKPVGVRTHVTQVPADLDRAPAGAMRPQQRQARRVEPVPAEPARGRKPKRAKRGRREADYPDFPRRRPLRGFLVGMFVVGGLAGAAYGVYTLMQNPQLLGQSVQVADAGNPSGSSSNRTEPKKGSKGVRRSGSNPKHGSPAVGTAPMTGDEGDVDSGAESDGDVRDIFRGVDTSFTTAKVDTSDLDDGSQGNRLRAARSISATELRSIYLDAERPTVRKYYPELWDPATNYGGTQGEKDAGALQINTSEVTRRIQGQYPSIKQCLLRSGGFTGSKARVVVNFTIYPNGRVSEVSIPSSDVQGTQFRACVVSVIQRMRFPKPKESSVVVIYPFVFSRN